MKQVRYLIFMSQLNTKVYVNFIVLPVEDLIIEEVLDDSFEQIKPLLITPSKCKKKVMYTSSPRKYVTKSTPTKLKKKLSCCNKKSGDKTKLLTI